WLVSTRLNAVSINGSRTDPPPIIALASPGAARYASPCQIILGTALPGVPLYKEERHEATRVHRVGTRPGCPRIRPGTRGPAGRSACVGHHRPRRLHHP